MYAPGIVLDLSSIIPPTFAHLYTLDNQDESDWLMSLVGSAVKFGPHQCCGQSMQLFHSKLIHLIH